MSKRSHEEEAVIHSALLSCYFMLQHGWNIALLILARVHLALNEKLSTMNLKDVCYSRTNLIRAIAIVNNIDRDRGCQEQRSNPAAAP